MRFKFLLLSISLILAVTLTVFAQGRDISGFILFDDGERVEFKAADSIEESLFKLLDSSKDGRCEVRENGIEMLTMVKNGQNVTVTFQGRTEEGTVSAIKQSFSNARATGRLSACKANLRAIGTALEMYYVDFGKYPESLAALVPEYLLAIPPCSGSQPPTYTYELLPEPVHYQLRCDSGNHESLGVEKGLPAYNGQEGLIEYEEESRE